MSAFNITQPAANWDQNRDIPGQNKTKLPLTTVATITLHSRVKHLNNKDKKTKTNIFFFI